eukprot:3242-Heterococcus_DN1.PRE.4
MQAVSAEQQLSTSRRIRKSNHIASNASFGGTKSLDYRLHKRLARIHKQLMFAEQVAAAARTAQTQCSVKTSSQLDAMTADEAAITRSANDIDLRATLHCLSTRQELLVVSSLSTPITSVTVTSLPLQPCDSILWHSCCASTTTSATMVLFTAAMYLYSTMCGVVFTQHERLAQDVLFSVNTNCVLCTAADPSAAAACLYVQLYTPSLASLYAISAFLYTMS